VTLPIELLRDLKCLHDAVTRGDTVTSREGVVTTRVRCGECDKLLYVRRVTLKSEVESGVTVEYHDQTYALLYTRAGRHELLKDLMTAQGLRFPQHWTAHGEDR
jgi:hypothetical protein